MRLSMLASRIVRRRRRGLTLMELVVVMVILIALAGILLPLFPSMLTRAHTSSTSTNLSEVNKAVQLYYNLYGQFPNNLDNLAAGVGTGGYVGAGVPPGPNGSTTADVITGTLAAADALALTNAGITSVIPIAATVGGAAGAADPTFYPYGPTTTTNPVTTYATTITPTSTTTVSQITPAAAARELGVQSLATGNSTAVPVFILLGLGGYSSMEGKTIDEAPVHFDDSAGGQPNVIYGRFGLVFQTQDGSGVALPQAKFVGAVDLADAGTITTANDHLQTFYNLK